MLHLLVVLFLIHSTSCHSQKSDKNKTSLEFNIETSYLLIPIEEGAPDVRMNIQYSDNKKAENFSVQLAKGKIDYWVKLDVKKHKGQRVSLAFENTESSALGLSNIKASDCFDFEYNEKYRPQFHFTPEYGWMNDPNGLVYLDGEYHLFYQYNPYGNKWGNMHWGHAVSTDLVSWTYLPTAIAPDSLGAIFSGSAVVDVNNTAGFGKNALVAIYTSAGAVQAQSIAYSTDKGRTFTKYSGNPVIPNPGIADFRDPKVAWNEQSKQWVMALATKQTITFYGSPDLKKWSKLSEFSNERGAHGGVWECPDLFPLTYEGKTKWVLLVSINPGGPNGGSATQYFIGNFDGKTFTADNLPYPLWLDYGRDNYAGVTFSNIPTTDGRRIFMGWMSNWSYAETVPSKYFRSATTIPRELKLINNGEHIVLAGLPVNEFGKLRKVSKSFPNQQVGKNADSSQLLPQFDGAYELVMNLYPGNANHFGFSFKNARNENLKCYFDLNAKKLQLDRTKSGNVDFNKTFAQGMVAPIVKKRVYNVRVLIDKASIELFVNGGETVLTSILFPSEAYEQLTFFSEDNAFKVRDLQISLIK